MFEQPDFQECPQCSNMYEQYDPFGEDVYYYQEPIERYGKPSFPFPPYNQGQFPPQYPPFEPGGTGQTGAPTSPPPSVVPQLSPQVKAVDPGTISGCMYRYTYIWPTFGRPYWFYPTRLQRRSISGYRWNGYMWMYYGTDLRNIKSFSCY